MLGSQLPLQRLVGGVHDQEQAHEDHFQDKDKVCIRSWPAVEFFHVEPAHFEYVSADQEYETAYQHQYRQDLKEAYQERI